MATMRPFLRRVEVSWIGLWLAGALCGVLLMLGIVMGTHTFERVQSIPVVSDIPSGYQMPRTDEEAYFRRLSGAQSVTTAGYDLPHADEETYYRQAPVAQPAASSGYVLPRIDEEAYYRVTGWGAPPPFEQARRSDPQ